MDNSNQISHFYLFSKLISKDEGVPMFSPKSSSQNVYFCTQDGEFK